MKQKYVYDKIFTKNLKTPKRDENTTLIYI